MGLDIPTYLMAKSGGGGGTSDYSDLTNKPSINGVTLSGNKTGADLGLLSGGYDIRVICAKITPTADDLADASNLINDLYASAVAGTLDNTKIVVISTNTAGLAKLHETIPSAYSLKQKAIVYSFYATAVHGYNASQTNYCGTTELRISGSWSNNVFTASGIFAYGNTGNEVVVLPTNNTKAYTPTGNYEPATKKYVDDSIKGTATNLATAYSSSATYNEGAYVTYDGNLYVCNTTISTAEAWTPAHWTQTTVMSELGNINTLLDSFVTVDEEEY